MSDYEYEGLRRVVYESGATFWPKTDGHGCGEWRGYELEPPEKPE